MKGIERFNYSQEAIAFQDGKLFSEIVKIFSDIRKEGRKDKFLNKVIGNYHNPFTATKLSKVVFESTGISIDCKFDRVGYACVNFPRLTSNNVLLGMWRSFDLSQDGVSLAKNKTTEMQGSIDLKNSKVSGVFSKPINDIYFDPGFFYDEKYTVEELAAIFLHELGHVFTYFEFLTETIITNLAVLTSVKRVLETNSVDERKVIFTRLEKDLNFKIPDVDLLSKEEDTKAIYMVLITGYADAARSSTDTKVYDVKSWEFLADQFSLRHGAGKHLASGMYKIHSGVLDKTSGGNVKRTVLYIFDAVNLIRRITNALAVTAILPPLGVFIIVSILFDDFALDSAPHDRGEQRLFRLKHGLVEQLKDPNITKEQKETLTEEISEMEELLSEMKDCRDIMEIFWDYARPARRDARKQYEYQLKMEKISSNSIYTKAAKLSTLS